VIQGFIVSCFDREYCTSYEHSPDASNLRRNTVGAFLGSLATATFGERLGRRKTIAVGVVVMMIGALLQATAYVRAHIIVARIVSGVGMGIINSTVPVYQAEFAPKATRGLCQYWVRLARAGNTLAYNIRRCVYAIVNAQLRNLHRLL
jgi:MFS family permease